MIVLGAVLGYITPFIRRRLLGEILGERPIDFMPRQAPWANKSEEDDIDSQYEADDLVVEADKIHGNLNVSSETIQSEQPVLNLKDKAELAKSVERANHFSQLATQRKLELDSYRGEVKQHFVDVAKVLNDDHKDTDALNQALINEIGVGAEQLVGARSMKGALDKQEKASQDITASVETSPQNTRHKVQDKKVIQEVQESEHTASQTTASLRTSKEIEFVNGVPSLNKKDAFYSDSFQNENDSVNYASEDYASDDYASELKAQADKTQKQDEWIPVEAVDEAKQEIDAFFVENQQQDHGFFDETEDDLQNRVATKRVTGENRFREIAEGIEGKSANTFSGVKTWFKGVAGVASASLPKAVLGKKANENKVSDLDRTMLLTQPPKEDVRYEDGVLIDDSVLDSQWNLDSVVMKDESESTTSFEARPDVKADVEQAVDIEEDYRSAFVYKSDIDSAKHDSELKLTKKFEDTISQNDKSDQSYGEAAKYLGLQQGFSGQSEEASEAIQTEVIAGIQVKGSDYGSDHGTDYGTDYGSDADSEMLDPYDRITDAVLKESSNQNMNDEKKIVHELFYVRGHQSNISGRAMSNINPGIPKDN